MEEQTVKLLNKTFTLTAILVVGILVFFVGQMAYQSRLLDQQNVNQITVSGAGKVYAKPDVAIISLGVTNTASTVTDVTKNNADKMNAVIEAVKKLGVEEKDIETTNYNLSPNYENRAVSMMYPYNGSTGKIVSYTLSQNIQVKIRDFDKISDILSQGTSQGANLVGNLQFTIDDPEQFKDQARAKAIEQAKTNAESLAKESGINLGKIINVYENYSPYSLKYDSMAVGLGGAMPEAAPAPTIQPGQQEINITINLTYRVR